MRAMLGGPPTLLSALNVVQALSAGAQAIRVSQGAGLGPRGGEVGRLRYEALLGFLLQGRGE